MTIIDLNEFYKRFQKNPGKEKLNLTMRAITVLFNEIQADHIDLPGDLIKPCYSDITEACGWPDFQDNGIFEQAINIAADVILQIHGFKPVHSGKYYISNSPKS